MGKALRDAKGRFCRAWKADRSMEFFDVNGKRSMRNLAIFVALIVASATVIYKTLQGTLTIGFFDDYLLFGGGVFGLGKISDDQTKRSQINADAAPPIVPQSVTTVNNPGGTTNVAGDAVTKPSRATK